MHTEEWPAAGAKREEEGEGLPSRLPGGAGAGNQKAESSSAVDGGEQEVPHQDAA